MASIHDLYGPAMELETEAEADAYLETLVSRPAHDGQTREEAERVEREWLGYYAGYCDNATRERVERLFKCEHPVFGKIAEKGPPSPEEAFRLGYEWGQRMRGEQP